MYHSIEKLIQDWCNECNTTCMTQRDYNKKLIKIITTRPGVMIGYKGIIVDKYKEKIKKYGWSISIIEAQEVHYPGNDWEKIIDERVLGYLEMEETK